MALGKQLVQASYFCERPPVRPLQCLTGKADDNNKVHHAVNN